MSGLRACGARCGLVLALALACRDTQAHEPGPAGACLAPGTWYVLKGDAPRAADASLLAELAQRDVLLLGEEHDDAEHHRWQLHTLAALRALRAPMVIGFESFPRRVQPVLDRWVAGDLSEKEFLARTEWDKVWNLPAQIYMPLFHFARMHRIPMLALNVERDLIQAISREGWDGVPAAKKEGLSRPAPATPAYRDELFEVYREHPRDKDSKARTPGREDPDFLRFVESQTTWDRAMAQALAGALRPAGGGARPLVIGVMGSGHLRGGHGVARQLRDLGVTRIGTLLPVDAGSDCATLGAGLADALFALSATPEAKPAPPRLGVRLDDTKDGVTIGEVVKGSLAERSGLKAADLVLSMAGAKISRAAEAIAAVRAQPDGTWLPMQVRRGGAALELVIKFPAAP